MTAPAREGDAAWDMLCQRLQRNPATSEETDTCTLRAAWKAMLAFAATRQPTPAPAAEGEGRLKASRDADPNAAPEGTLEALATCATMLETYMPECEPANEHGQVSFVRCMTDATAAEIRAFIANQETRNG